MLILLVLAVQYPQAHALPHAQSAPSGLNMYGQANFAANPGYGYAPGQNVITAATIPSYSAQGTANPAMWGAAHQGYMMGHPGGQIPMQYGGYPQAMPMHAPVMYPVAQGHHGGPPATTTAGQPNQYNGFGSLM